MMTLHAKPGKDRMAMVHPTSLLVPGPKHKTGYKVQVPVKYPRLQWLADLLWRALHGMGALREHYHSEQVRTFRYTEAHETEVRNAISEAAYLAGKSHLLMEDCAILIGNDDFCQMLQSTDPQSTQAFNIMVRMNHAQYAGQWHDGPRYQTTYYDLPVHVLPTMRGVIVVPRVLIERAVAPARAPMEEQSPQEGGTA